VVLLLKYKGTLSLRVFQKTDRKIGKLFAKMFLKDGSKIQKVNKGIFDIKSAKEFNNLGIDEIFCVLVNDVYVAKVWGETTGATKAGIKIITDPLSVLAETLDFEFTVKGTGLLRRLQRFTAVIENKKIEKLYFEKERGVCDNTSAQTVLRDLA